MTNIESHQISNFIKWNELNVPFSIMDRTTMQKIIKNREEIKNNISQINSAIFQGT